MLKENWNATEKINYSDLNLIISEIKSLCLIYNIEESLSSLGLGDFLFSEMLQKIENAIDTICDRTSTEYVKKNWYNMTVIDYTDINRWAKVLNIISNMQSEGNTLVTEEGNKIITEDGNYIVTEGA